MEWYIYIPPGLLFSMAIAIGYSLIPGRLNFWIGTLLKYPTITVMYSIVSVELIFYGAIRLFILLVEAIIASPKHRKLRKSMEEQTSYLEWLKLAKQLDESKRSNNWQDNLNDFTAKHFNWSFLQQLTTDMKLARHNGDDSMALVVLQQCVRKNIGGIFREELYSYTNTGEPKKLVLDFVEEIVKTLKWLTEREIEKCSSSSDDVHPAIKNPLSSVSNFLERARVTYGRTALCLSGGGMMALYHLGAVKALLEENILPHIISGASAGGLIAALICTRTPAELERDLSPEVLQPKFTCCSRTWPKRIQSLCQNGSMFDNDEWLELVRWFTCGDMTFQEAYLKTHRVLCITLSTTTRKAPPTVLNHISAPNIVIASAVIASASMPIFLRPMFLRTKNPVTGKIEILKEEYWDGSIEQDIPTSGLAEMLNCQFFIVAQANPHVVPFIFNCDGDIGRPNRWSHSRRGGYILSGLELYLKMDMKNKLNFLHAVGAVTGFTAILMTQDFAGTSTIVPHVKPIDFLRAVEDPTMDDMHRYFQGGTVAAYRNFSMIRLHYKLAQAMDDCLLQLRQRKLERKNDDPFEEAFSAEAMNEETQKQVYQTTGSIWNGAVTDL